eukprot:3094243-Pleurochrysis_carterae.AAC.1
MAYGVSHMAELRCHRRAACRVVRTNYLQPSRAWTEVLLTNHLDSKDSGWRTDRGRTFKVSSTVVAHTVHEQESTS